MEEYKPNPEQLKLQARYLLEGSMHTWSYTDRVLYIKFLNERAGLPFGTIGMIETGKGEKVKVIPYASRSTTVELGKLHNISCQQMKETITPEQAIYTYRATDVETGRFMEAVGACSLVGTYPSPGEFRANKTMHAETKAKRRATLELCGLAFIDDSEVESIGDMRRIPLEGEVVAAGDTTPKPAVPSQTLSAPSAAPASSPSQSAPTAAPAGSKASASSPKESAGSPPVASIASAPSALALAFEPPARYKAHAALFQGEENAIAASPEHIKLMVDEGKDATGWGGQAFSKWLGEAFDVTMKNKGTNLTVAVFRRCMGVIDAELTKMGK